jgi:hypothetical protein
MTWPRVAAAMALFLLPGVIEGYLGLSAAHPAATEQAPMIQARLTGYQVTFQFTQDPRQTAPATNDQITVLFANRSAEGPRPMRPLFGDDIVQEFSFSGMDFEGNQLRFTRRVRDKSFLSARYIRVVNHGNDGWQGDKISLTVDGEEILNAVSMTRGGAEPSKGFQKFNPRDWSGRTYWEAELGRFRKSRAH